MFSSKKNDFLRRKAELQKKELESERYKLIFEYLVDNYYIQNDKYLENQFFKFD